MNQSFKAIGVSSPLNADVHSLIIVSALPKALGFAPEIRDVWREACTKKCSKSIIAVEYLVNVYLQETKRDPALLACSTRKVLRPQIIGEDPVYSVRVKGYPYEEQQEDA